ncbi:hypothetical protein NDU88_001085 [Pleurodeles waltl]|uniref:Uncharacterized protein n=1 Tax=Pleurodeles waltl TaxID=8319 RepID=A0AAV7THR7_PLEWA|nr:hypothetical protein NDU88_001085 [Pleurodeles waltl]
MMSHAGWMIAVWFVSLDSNKPWHKQSLRLVEKVLPGTRRDLVASTQEEETELQRVHSESLRRPGSAHRSPTARGQRRRKKEAHAALHNGIPCRRRTTQEAGRRRQECWVPGLHEAQRTSWKDANKPCQLQNTQCMGGTVSCGEASSYLHQSWTAGLQFCRDHFSLPPVFFRRGDPSHRSSLQRDAS